MSRLVSQGLKNEGARRVILGFIVALISNDPLAWNISLKLNAWPQRKKFADGAHWQPNDVPVLEGIGTESDTQVEDSLFPHLSILHAAIRVLFQNVNRIMSFSLLEPTS